MTQVSVLYSTTKMRCHCVYYPVVVYFKQITIMLKTCIVFFFFFSSWSMWSWNKSSHHRQYKHPKMGNEALCTYGEYSICGGVWVFCGISYKFPPSENFTPLGCLVEKYFVDQFSLSTLSFYFFLMASNLRGKHDYIATPCPWLSLIWSLLTMNIESETEVGGVREGHNVHC